MKIISCSLLLTTLLISYSNITTAVPISPKGLQSPSVQVTPAGEAYNKGLAALGKNDFKSAEDAFKESLKLEPAFVPSILGLGHVAIQQNKPSEAEQWLSKAQQVAPNDPTVYTSLGRYQFSQKQFQKAEASFKKAISLDPKAFSPRIDLADLYLNGTRRLKEAITSYHEAISIKPDHAGAHFGLGSALLANNNPSEAIKEFEKSASLAPDNPIPLQFLGKAYFLNKEPSKALDAFNKAVKVKQDFIAAYLDKGDVYASMNKDSEALKEYQAVLKFSPKNVDAYVKQSMIYQKQKQWGKAQESLLKAIEIDNKNALVLNNLAWLTTEQRSRLDDGIAWAKKAIAISPDNPEYQDTLGWVLYTKKEPTLAIEILEKASKLKIPHAGVFYHLGILYSETGRNKDAVTAFKKSIAINGNSAEAADAKLRLAKLNKAS